MSVRENEVRLGKDGEIKTVTMRHPPKVGGTLVVEGEEWLVLSISYEIPFRAGRQAVSFVVPNKQETA